MCITKALWLLIVEIDSSNLSKWVICWKYTEKLTKLTEKSKQPNFGKERKVSETSPLVPSFVAASIVLFFFPKQKVSYNTEPTYLHRSIEIKGKTIIFPVKHVQLSQIVVTFSACYGKMLATLIQHKYVGHLMCNSLQTQLGSSPASPFVTVVILLLVFIWIHWGMGLFCFCFLSSNLFILKVLREDIVKNGVNHTHLDGRKKWQLQLFFNSCHSAQDTNTEEKELDWFGLGHMPVLGQGSLTIPPKLREGRWGSFPKDMQGAITQKSVRWQNCLWIGIIPCTSFIISKVTKQQQ